MTNTWLRLWHDMPTDPKFRVIARKTGRPISEVLSVFVLMMTNASANEDERGELDNWSDEDAGAALDIDADHVAAIRQAMQGKTLDGVKLSGWSRRQPKREDNSAERVRAFRERSKRDVTLRNADVTHGNSREEERREEESQSVTRTPAHEPAREAQPDGRTDGDEVECKAAFNGSTEIMLAFVEHAMGGHCRKNAAQWLANLTRINGQQAVAEAYQKFLTAKAEGQIIARPLPWFDKTAKNCKAEAKTTAPVENPFAEQTKGVVRFAKPAPRAVAFNPEAAGRA